LGVQEIVRVLQPEACIFVIDEKGPKNPIRERFAKALQEAGIVPRLPGTRDSDEVATAFLRAGCRAETLDVSGLRWTATFRSGDALDQLRDRLSAEFWSVADDDYERALAATLSWVEAQPGGREAGGVIEPHLSVSVFRTARPLNTANL
jgi:hypothetical protein